GGLGFEPRLAESESAVLPLDDPPTGQRSPTDRDRTEQTESSVRVRRLQLIWPAPARVIVLSPKPWRMARAFCMMYSTITQAGGQRRPSAEGLGLEATVPSPQAGSHPTTPSHGGEATYAALDLGTNNCRLLIARPNGRHLRIIDAFSRIVRLGEGLAGSWLLSEEAMARAIDALKVCAHKIRRRAVTHARGVATEACRRARNCEAFLTRVYAETGLEIETITSAEEAVLAFKGCSPLLSARRPRAVVFD